MKKALLLLTLFCTLSTSAQLIEYQRLRVSTLGGGIVHAGTESLFSDESYDLHPLSVGFLYSGSVEYRTAFNG